MPPLLQLEQATIRFGGVLALSALDLQLRQHEVAGLIGPNGAGKTTAFNLITGVYSPTSGRILFDGESIAGRAACQIAARGIARTFQNIRLFASLSVFDNVRAVFHLQLRHDARHALWRGRAFHAEERRIAGEVMALLELFQLGAFRDQPATQLSYGDQRRLEMARALVARPKLLLLDEPAAGMNATEKAGLARLIRLIRERFAVTILLVEHDMRLVMDVCERLIVLDHGVKIAEGPPEEIRRSPRVIAAYLGAESHA